MKKYLSIILVLTLFVLAKQGSPSTRVYLTPQGTETTDQNQAMVYEDLKSAYTAQLNYDNGWEIINIQ